jgi:hypothetical protein
MQPNNYLSKNGERGNVFLFILLGVILFAALAFAVSRGFRSDTTTAMSQRKAELLAVDVISFGQRLERTVAKMQRSGISENDISFENSIDAGYAHTPSVNANNIFHGDGGALSRQGAPSGANDGSAWHFTGHTCIADIGTGATGCASNTAADEELIAVLPNVNATVCAIIDKKLGISSIPANTGTAYSATKFTGTYADGSEIILDRSRNAACYSLGGNYYFYHVLIAR